MLFNILNIAIPTIQIKSNGNMMSFIKGGDATNNRITMKGGDAYKVTQCYRQKMYSDVPLLRFFESKVGGAR